MSAMTGLLDYVPGETFLHRLNPLTKLIFAFALSAACFISRDLYPVLGILALNLVLAGWGGVLKRSLKVFFSLVKFSLPLFIVQVLVIREGEALWHLPFENDVFTIPITGAGLHFSLFFVARLIAAALPLTLALSVTPISGIANALTERLGIPCKYTFALTAALRFIPLFAAEMEAVMEAQIARGVDFDTRNFFKKIRLILPLCVPLLISSVRKIEGGAISAELRGFKLRKRGSAWKRDPFRAGDWGALLVAVMIIAGVMAV